MMTRTLASVFALLFVTALAFGYSSGPPAGYAGNMGNTCTQCHSSFPLNSGDGSLTLDVGGMTEYEPGETYTFSVNLEDPGQSRWGFQLTAEDESDNFAGDLIATDGTNTQLVGGNNYIEHTSSGTQIGQDMGTWTFDWTAPAEGTGEVTFFIAGNAANGNFSTSGDYIYNTQLVLMESTGGGGPVFETVVMDDMIPAQGGTLEYDVTLQAVLPNPVPGVSYWTKVELPNGSMTGTLFSITTTIPANPNMTVGLTQDIPGFAPAGSYMHYSYLGFMPNPILTASFGFMKSANASDDAPVNGWDATGDFDLVSGEGEAVAATPSAFELKDAYPNPFNNMTTVTVALPEAADLNLRVVNILGETVATLADGRMAAGEQAFTFNAAGLSSGVYFVQATVPGELNAVQKVTLIQ